jgi:hypothetical protein
MGIERGMEEMRKKLFKILDHRSEILLIDGRGCGKINGGSRTIKILSSGGVHL